MEAPVSAPTRLAPADVAPIIPIVQPPTNSASMSSTAVLATPHDSSTQLKPQTSGDDPQVAVQGPASTDHAEVSDHAAQVKSYSTRSSGLSKKPTRFFGNPLRHSVKSITESVPVEPSPQPTVPEQTLTTPFTPIGSQLPFPGTKEQTNPFKRIRIDEHENNLQTQNLHKTLFYLAFWFAWANLSTSAIVPSSSFYFIRAKNFYCDEFSSRGWNVMRRPSVPHSILFTYVYLI